MSWYIVVGLAIFAIAGFMIFQIGLSHWGRELRRREDWDNAPEESGRATLLEKRSEVVDTAHPSRAKTIYQGVFRLEKGTRRMLTMEEADYLRLQEGSTGTVRYQGLKFLSFESDQT